jgi:hypothetical protein
MPTRIRVSTLVRRSVLAAILVLAVVAVFPSSLLAHTDPPGSTTTGVSLTMTAFRSDGVTPVLPGTVSECGETIIYRSTLAWAGPPAAAIQGGTLTITTPDGVPHDVTPVGGIPCLGGTDGVICTPGVNSVNSQTVSYTVGPTGACTPGTQLTASVSYTNGTAHLGANDIQGVTGSTPFPLTLECCPTPTPTPTATNTPVNTPTETPTNTPSNTPSEGPPPPDVPTLSFPMMVLLGLLLAGTGLFLARR